VAGPANSTNLIKNRYQQTWHTIEFSNNRHTRHHPNQRSGSLRSNFSNLPARYIRVKSAVSIRPSLLASGSPCRLAPGSGAKINSTTTLAECQLRRGNVEEGPESRGIPGPPPSETTTQVAGLRRVLDQRSAKTYMSVPVSGASVLRRGARRAEPPSPSRPLVQQPSVQHPSGQQLGSRQTVSQRPVSQHPWARQRRIQPR
jgi:hypothetical protein